MRLSRVVAKGDALHQNMQEPGQEKKVTKSAASLMTPTEIQDQSSRDGAIKLTCSYQ